MSFKNKRFTQFFTAAAFLLPFTAAMANNIESVTATGFDEKNNHRPENMIDGDTKTRWAINEKDHSAVFKLKSEMAINNIALFPFKPVERQLTFDLATSTDNSQWTPLATGIVTSGKYDKGEKFVLKTPVKAQYLKITVHGTNVNKWSAISEVEVNSSKPLPETVLP